MYLDYKEKWDFSVRWMSAWRTQIITGPRFPVMHDSGTMLEACSQQLRETKTRAQSELC